jgi:hypothetical protein
MSSEFYGYDMKLRFEIPKTAYDAGVYPFTNYWNNVTPGTPVSNVFYDINDGSGTDTFSISRLDKGNFARMLSSGRNSNTNNAPYYIEVGWENVPLVHDTIRFRISSDDFYNGLVSTS